MDAALLDAVRAGDRRALSQAITLVEEGAPLDGTIPDAPPIIGFTGPPGAGKSTLIAALIERIRGRGKTVAVLAVDPSSPVTGGAILGDRIRMQAHVDDPGVYIRSMASRGHLGGLSEAAGDAVRLMRLAGFDWVFVETVGVGQSEVEVMGLADVVVLVVGPSWGDQVQADKAGVVEVADLFVVNKADRSGAAEVKRALTEAARARGAEVLLVSAITGEGVAEVLAAVDRLAGS
ncbi:MAG TPA: methylmalonyl Co-A mutase-associated GTPase MeaB [Acidimicrobiia bacterium]|nr:methylmalonyl Co-A mutase-associated GTPase MeaB [Acidimicrobiia bacterium]